ncbi:hypothetical protein HY414_02730 [Candidatus Kaiserbacteria bacterium]|nr:hypothetical protein [Candidatus Kaiserbacteria bacterium]
MTLLAKRSLISLGAIGVAVFLVSASFAYAQSPTSGDSVENFPGPSTVAAPTGTVNCFDYYRFGSVQANIAAQTSSAVSGTPITFTGTLENQNSYPIIDGALYVKVFRLRDNPREKNVNGPFVVDQFFVRDGINLPTGGRMPVIFTWDIPSYTPSGRYEVATFFTTSKKYNLLGLSFTDDVVGNRAGFSVVGEVQDIVAFDKDKVTVDGDIYRFAAFPPRVSTTAPVPVEAVVTNETDTDAHVSVRWQAYAWDQGRFENLVSQDTQSVVVPKNGTAKASYTVQDAKYPVYLVVGTLSWQNTQSVINVRFVRSGVDRTRINFPAITAFPLVAGEATTLFSCLHNSGESAVVPNGRLELKLSDSWGRKIHEYVYEGDVTGAMMGVAEAFTPKNGYNVVNLDASLYQGGALVDEAHLTYDCNEIDPAACLPDSETAGAFSLFSFAGDSSLPAILGLALLILILALLAWMLVRRLSKGRSGPPPMPPSVGIGSQIQ